MSIRAVGSSRSKRSFSVRVNHFCGRRPQKLMTENFFIGKNPATDRSMMLDNGVKKIAIFLGAIFLAAVIGIIDMVTGFVPDVTILYLIPIILVTLVMGIGYGITIALIASVAETYSNITLGIGFTTALVLDALMHLLIFILSAVLISRLHDQIRLITELEQKRSYDLTIAKEVHKYTFKPFTGKMPGLAIETKVAFAGELGGDYIYIADVDNKLFFCIGDISGKSVAAALYSALLHQNIILALKGHPDLTSIVKKVNAQIFEATPENMFITLLFAFIDNDTVSYINAGHEPPLLYSKKRNEVRSLTSEEAFPVGIKPTLEIEQSTIPFDFDDILLSFTDGVSDSEYFKDNPYEKLASELLHYYDENPRIITEAIFTKAVPAENEILSDDVIIACIKKLSDTVSNDGG